MFQTRRSTADALRSQRSLAMGRRGMVCTSQTLASSAGLACLQGGGNAVDAAITAAAVLGVVEPFSTGIGGDCFMLIWRQSEQRLYALNGSGRAPAAATVDAFRARGLSEIPPRGILAVTVPGAVDAWSEALGRFGTRPLADVLAPAIAHAEEGFPVTEIIAHQWDLIVRATFLQDEEATRVFTIDGEAPRLGAIVHLPDLAGSLRLLASGGRDVFYRGELAERIAAFSRAQEGLLELDDLAAHASTWVEPISTDYRGYQLFELPPNTQGLTALIALNILENFALAGLAPETPESWHLRIEAVKLAFADRNRFIADPERARVPVAELLSKDYAQGRAAMIHPHKAITAPAPGKVRAGTDTVYLTAADADGNVVSLINSLYAPFGSGMVVPGTGIALQNRGRGFVLDPAHPNCIAPGKRPFHTIIPAMLFRSHRPVVSFGVMGGDVQAQAHVQVVSNLVDYQCNIQEALDAPRFHYLDGARVVLEDATPPAARQGLVERGHRLEPEWEALLRGGFGGGQGIMIDPVTGAYWGGSDCRKDGCAIGY